MMLRALGEMLLRSDPSCQSQIDFPLPVGQTFVEDEIPCRFI